MTSRLVYESLVKSKEFKSSMSTWPNMFMACHLLRLMLFLVNSAVPMRLSWKQPISAAEFWYETAQRPTDESFEISFRD